MIGPAHLLLALALASAATAQSKNLLFYGNSFSFFNGGVAPLMQLIAIEAEPPSPTIVQRLAAGQDLQNHATDPGQGSRRSAIHWPRARPA